MIGLVDALVGMLERLAARSSLYKDTIRVLERRVDALEPIRDALTEAGASINRKESQLEDMRTSRISLAKMVGAWMQDQPSCTRIAPTDGTVVHLIADASQSTVLVIAYAGSIQSDAPVRAFSDEESTYIVLPSSDRNTYETRSVVCGPTVVELQYRITAYIREVMTAFTSDATCVVTLMGRNLFRHNTMLQVRCSNPSNDILSSTDVASSTPDGTKLSVRFDVDLRSVLTEWSCTCQLLNVGDSRLASNVAQVLFHANLDVQS